MWKISSSVCVFVSCAFVCMCVCCVCVCVCKKLMSHPKSLYYMVEDIEYKIMLLFKQYVYVFVGEEKN